MKWKEALSRITGFSVPIFGVSWNPPEAERAIARRVLALLEDRRVLYRLTEYEYPQACQQSVDIIRSELTSEIGRLETGGHLAEHLRAIRTACRAFLNRIQGNDLGVTRISDYPYPAKHWEFIEALNSLRKDVGYRVAALSIMFGIDIEPELESIIPPSSSESDDAETREDAPE